MIADHSVRRALRRSLLASLAFHMIMLLLLTWFFHSVAGGAGGSLLIKIGTTEPLPQPEILLVNELMLPRDADENQAFDSDPFAPAEDPVVHDAIQVASMETSLVSAHDSSETTPIEKPNSAEGASFFGTLAQGNQFVYLVDTSPSMNIGRGRGASDVSRLIRALAELRASIERLSPDQSFYVILFNGQTRRMFDEQSVAPRALPATPEHKRRLNDWLSTVRTGESTDPRRALQLGLNMHASAIFLLSDGIFDVPEATVLEFIQRHNHNRTPIHTIAYEDERSCRTMLRIADWTGGEYRFVPAPSRDGVELSARSP
ncbi:MAG TPA: hypothetical protein VG826_33770 [Pirellulales bacterium]|nr:hypothetical protein [Pirellulales bacterium]